MEQENNFHMESPSVSHCMLGALEETSNNYYDVLDVSYGASRLEIREAYLRLKGTFSAGSSAFYSIMSDDMAQEQLALVEEAYRILSDVAERRAYDLKMGINPGDKRDQGPFSFDLEGSVEFSALDSGTERILLSRAQANELEATLSGLRDTNSGSGMDASGNEGSDPLDVPSVRTTRSTLPIVRLQVSGAETEELRKVYSDLVKAHDPGDGSLYRKLREAAQVSEEEMKERIKVSVAYIRAIETNELETLPQIVYVKGFLRSYFRYLNVPDSETLVTAFAERLKGCQEYRKI